MKVSANGLAIIKAFESCLRNIGVGKFKAYIDPVGVLTIGWGHTNHHEPKFSAGTVWTQAQCDAALAGDMATFEEYVSRLAKVPLKQNEFDALVSWAFNTGGPKTATLWKRLNAGDKSAIPRELAKWNRGGGRELPGLTRRRKAEGEMFAGDIAAAFRTAQIKSRPVVFDNSEPVSQPPREPEPNPVPQAQPEKASIASIIISIIAKLFGSKTP